VEVAVVFVVAAVVSVLGLKVVEHYSSYSSATNCRSDKRNVQNAVAAYYAQHGTYAASLDALVSDGLLTKRPGGDGYTIGYDGAGTVTVTGTCS
jgi:competence protein ComGC